MVSEELIWTGSLHGNMQTDYLLGSYRGQRWGQRWAEFQSSSCFEDQELRHFGCFPHLRAPNDQTCHFSWNLMMNLSEWRWTFSKAAEGRTCARQRGRPRTVSDLHLSWSSRLTWRKFDLLLLLFCYFCLEKRWESFPRRNLSAVNCSSFAAPPVEMNSSS